MFVTVKLNLNFYNVTQSINISHKMSFIAGTKESIDKRINNKLKLLKNISISGDQHQKRTTSI